MSDSLLDALIDEQLGSVVFVMDYLQLDFSAARLTAYVWPAVTRAGVTRRFGDPGLPWCAAANLSPACRVCSSLPPGA